MTNRRGAGCGCRNPPAGRWAATPGSPAYRIAIREAMRAGRRRRRDLSLRDEPAAIDDAAVETPFVDPVLIRACADRLAELPPAAEITLRLHYLEEMSLAETAEALEIPVGTVKSRLAYGLASLRERLGPMVSG